MKNNEIMNTLGLDKFQDTLESNRFKWFWHVMRMSQHRLDTKLAIELKIKERDTNWNTWKEIEGSAEE